MGLVDLTTNLKSLKFGHDRKQGASSGQPYIQTPIPGGDNSTLSQQITDNSLLGSDFILRGGALAPLTSFNDALRLSKFFTDFKSFRGPGFIVKQEILANQNPKTGAGPGRFYLPTNTLAQTAFGSFNTHFQKNGKLTLSDEDKYFSKTKSKSHYNTSTLGAGNKNKMLLLYETKIITPKTNDSQVGDALLQMDQGIGKLNLANVRGGSLMDDIKAPGEARVNIDAFKGNLENFGISSEPTQLFNYQGGPNATIGGKTITRRVFNSNEGIERNFSSGESATKFLVYTPDMIVEKKPIGKTGSTGFGSSGIVNFESKLLDKTKTGVDTRRTKQLIGNPSNYRDFNRSKTYGEGDPGARGKDRSVYYSTNLRSETLPDNFNEIFTPDKINAKSLYSSETLSAKKGVGYDDIIKFNIGVVDLDSTSEPKSTSWIHLRAYITSFSDTHSASWNGFNYMGRGNSFYKYSGYTRSIAMGFDAVVHSRYEQAFVYDKLNYLASLTAPNYSSGGFMRGNIIKLTVGDYLNNVYGILNGVNYTIDNETPWDIARDVDGNEDPNALQLPHKISVSGFTFTPIHSFVDKTVSTDYIKGVNARPDENFISLGTNGEGYDATYSARKESNGTKSETQS